jgi:SAM-dependent methyltransferase/predicted thioesterase
MPRSTSDITGAHLERVRAWYDAAPTELKWASLGYRVMLAHYYNLLIPADATVLELGCGSGELLKRLKAKRKVGLDLSEAQIAAARRHAPDCEFHVQAAESLELSERFDYIVISDTLNFAADVQQIFERLHTVSHPRTRLIVNYHSSLWRPLFALAGSLGLKAHAPQSNWLATEDVAGLMELADWSALVRQPRILCPVRAFGIGDFINRWFAPILPWFCITVFAVARSVRSKETGPLVVSVVIPARNEAGNIEAAVLRTPNMGAGTELIFVEGHSKDNTWEEIERVAAKYPDRRIKTLRQAGRGKGDAVRAGFAVAEGDLFMILDADLTVPPEEMVKFYDAVVSGRTEFANGSRLVYPMEKAAMQFLNMMANKIFGILFSHILGQHMKDTLCGTKVLRRGDYERIAANRGYFGEFDPFGDFDLLFGAARLNLQIVDIPVRYRDRSYGTTNIQRWSHGWLLLRMVIFAARKIKFV